MSNKPTSKLKKNGKDLMLPKCLGPVQNLEEYVRSDWWNKIFNAYYLKTDGDVVEDMHITSREIDLFSNILHLERNHKILDLCCGQGRHSLELANRGYHHVEGLDRSRYLIQKAKNTAKKNGYLIKFKDGDARQLPYSTDSFDEVLILGNSFGYFETINEDLKVLKEVQRVLRPWGKLLIDISDGEYLQTHFQPRSWEWIDKNYFVCRERSLSLDGQRLISREVINHVNKGVLVDQFYSERLYSKDKIKDLLLAAGFSDITFHGSLSPQSQRNQDLGMMERRILVSAVVKKEWTDTISKKQITKNITVIMGDPHKPDILKPDHLFDDDDFETINQLKSALKDLPGYDFRYLSNHDTLIKDLIDSKGSIDYIFNLCDEGYYNDAIMELHVPALLEIMGVPYTGGGPQCLAYCYDKSLVRGIAKEMGIPVPEAILIKPGDMMFDLPLYFPAIVKPNFGDSSFGITQKSVVQNGEQLISAIYDIREKFGYDKPILVEQYLTGKDLTVGIIGNPPKKYMVLPISEDDYSELPTHLPKICGYEAKWDPNSPYWNIKSIPAELEEETTQMIETCCLRLFERLECRDYARFDWRLDSEGNPKLLEVNPNPGWCWDGHLAKMAKYGGYSYAEMLNLILEAAEDRFNLKEKLHNKDSELR